MELLQNMEGAMFGMSTRWSLLQGLGIFLSILTISVPAQAQTASLSAPFVGEAIRTGSAGLRPRSNIVNPIFSLPPTNEWEAFLSRVAWFNVEGGSSTSPLLTIVGHGGLPKRPNKPLSADVVWLDNPRVNIASQQRGEKPSNKPPTVYDAVKIAPATGWVFDGKGHVTLISCVSKANNLESTPACQKQ